MTIAGWGSVRLRRLLCDFNGTLAVDGKLAPAIRAKLDKLAAGGLEIYILTADTHGSAAGELTGLPVRTVILEGEDTATAKLAFLEKVGPAETVVIGNGRNDLLMVQNAALAMVVLGQEGCYLPTLLAARIVVNRPEDALDLLLCPGRLQATLRG